MSFNRNIYDSKAYELKLNTNSNFSNYNIYGSYAEHTEPRSNYCSTTVDTNSTTTSKEPGDLSHTNIIDVESKLSWRNDKLSKHGQDMSEPANLILPFLIYNLEGSDRETFTDDMPWILKNFVVPIIWKSKWEKMKPFLLA